MAITMVSVTLYARSGRVVEQVKVPTHLPQVIVLGKFGQFFLLRVMDNTYHEIQPFMIPVPVITPPGQK